MLSLTEQGDLPHNQRNSKWRRAIKLSCPPPPFGTRLRVTGVLAVGRAHPMTEAAHKYESSCTSKAQMSLLWAPHPSLQLMGRGSWNFNQLTKKRLNQLLKTIDLTLWTPLLYSLLVLLMPFLPLRDSSRMLFLNDIKPTHCVNLTSVCGFPCLNFWDGWVSLRCEISSLQNGGRCNWKRKPPNTKKNQWFWQHQGK